MQCDQTCYNPWWSAFGEPASIAVPVVTPETNTKEFMTPSDQVIVTYRDKLKEWDRRGWRLDFDQVERDARKVAYAIPGPERRTHKGWVLDAAPVVAADTARSELEIAGESPRQAGVSAA